MMTRISTHRGSIRWLLVVAVLPLLAMIAHAQGGTITADPNAQQLRLIWKVTGKPFVGGDKVGAGAGGLGDIYGIGKGAWAVYYGTALQWRIYRNDSDDIAKDTVPIQVFDSLGAVPSHPILGDFWGTGSKAVAFPSGNVDQSGPRTKYYYELHVHRTESKRIADTPAVVFNGRTVPMKYEFAPDDVLAVDLDGDDADELVMVWQAAYADTGFSEYPEVWIYRGGEDFQLATPTKIIRHPLLNGGGNHVHAAAGDFDGDGHVDIVMTRANGDERDHLTFYWGTGDLSTFGSPENTRIIMLGIDHPDAGLGFVALDCDGDERMDLALDRTYSGQKGTYLYRSGSKKNVRTRSYRMDDADITFPGLVVHSYGGYLNDSTRKCEMLGFGKLENDGSTLPNLTLFSGGPDGPDLAYDAYNAGGLGQIPIYDVDGDGWDELMGGNYAFDNEGGIAAIFAGGPYIPSPKRSDVEVIAGEGHVQAVTVWPNPARDELHIAWRGDLKHMPSRFSVHDVLGRIVASGDVESWRGTALWQCEDVASGIYLLSIYDINNTLIATTRIIKQ